MPYKGKAGKKEKHVPLSDEIANDALAQGKGRTKKRERQPEDEFMTDAMSNKVLLQARKQLEEVEAGDDDGERPAATPTLGRSLVTAIHEEDSDAEDFDEDDPVSAARRAGVFGGEPEEAFDDDAAARPADNASGEYYEDVELSPEDEKALAAFAAPRAGKERVLADIILEKIQAKERGGGVGGVDESGGGADEMLIPDGIDTRVVEVYRQVGDLLRRYTVGKIPKAFKIIRFSANERTVCDGWMLAKQAFAYVRYRERGRRHAPLTLSTRYVSSAFATTSLACALAAIRAPPAVGRPMSARTCSPVGGHAPPPRAFAFFFRSPPLPLFASASGSKRSPSNSLDRHPRNAHFMSERCETRVMDSGISANAPDSSPSMMESTMTHGPMASAISLDGDSAPTERPSADAAAVCSASVPSNAPRPATFRPAMR